MTPRSEALAFRIWQIAEPLGWNVTSKELAEKLSEPVGRVAQVIKWKRWSSRVRTTRLDIGPWHNEGRLGMAGNIVGFDRLEIYQTLEGYK